MQSFWKIVNKVIEESDILLEVLDARLVNLSRNREVEEKIIRKDKKLIFCMNKCDLVPKHHMDKMKKILKPSVFVSARQHLGTTMLKKLIYRLANKDKITVGVIGYPNTGKSSIINALCGKKSAKTSSYSGFTRGIQKISAGRLMLLDTPGVIPFRENDVIKHALIGATDPSKIKDPESAAQELIECLDGAVQKHYDVLDSATLSAIALKKNRLISGGRPDTAAISRMIITAWQKGKISIQ